MSLQDKAQRRDNLFPSMKRLLQLNMPRRLMTLNMMSKSNNTTKRKLRVLRKANQRAINLKVMSKVAIDQEPKASREEAEVATEVSTEAEASTEEEENSEEEENIEAEESTEEEVAEVATSQEKTSMMMDSK